MRDAIVIGAGPAGSFSALLLARAGWRVTILEQHAFPRDKVCGECLSSRGTDVLRRAGMLDELETRHPNVLRGVALHAINGRSLSLALPRPMMGVSRHLLDGYLLDAAARAGAVVRHRVRCERLEPASRPRVRVRDLSTNQLQTLEASRVILADGKASLVGNAPRHTGDFGIKSHFVGINGPRDAIEMFGCADCYGGIAAIEQDRCNVSFSVPQSRLVRARDACRKRSRKIALAQGNDCRVGVLAHRLPGEQEVGGYTHPTFSHKNASGENREEGLNVSESGPHPNPPPEYQGRGKQFTSLEVDLASGNYLDDLLDQLAAENPTLGRRMVGAQRVSPWIASPVPRFGTQPPIGSNIHRVGNGSAAMEPICGEGMGVALRSAELTVAALLESTGDRCPTENPVASIARSATWSLRRGVCRAGGLLASSPPASQVALALLEHLNLGPAVLRLIGKN